MKPDAMVRDAARALPPSVRSPEALRLTAAAAVGRFELQVCQNCGAVQYPPREACHRCLSSAVEWVPQAGGADLLSETTLLHSHDEYFRARLPIRLGLVRLDVGPTAVVYLGDGVAAPPCRVRVEARLDKSGQGVLVANSGDGALVRSAHLREMSCDPSGRRVLVADAGSASGVALVRSLVDVGADVVWAGCGPESARRGGLSDLLGGLEQVRFVSLDATSEGSVRALADQIGPQVDVLIDNVGFDARGDVGTEPHAGTEPQASPAPRVPSGPDSNSARVEPHATYFASMRLAQAFGQPMRTTAATAPVGSPLSAWVNLFAFDTLVVAPQSTFPASGPAAAYSFARSLRAEMRPAGIRVLNVFAGPLNDGRDRGPPAAKLTPVALARAVIKALQDGIEDLYPGGELPRDWVARWCNNPKEHGLTDR